VDPAITSLLTIAGSGIAAYYGAYLKKRGEDQAMKEGFAEVLRQTTETTRATKAIEAKISDEMWDRQKQWELKRDILLEMIKRIAAMDDALTSYKSFVDLDNKRVPEGGELDTRWAEQKLNTKRTWNKAAADFDETRAIVDAICSPEVKKTADDLAIFTKLVAMQLSKGETQQWAQYQMEAFQRIKRAKAAIRRELGLNLITSQSDESSAAPNPAPPNPEVS
jgi:hypothetical protein